MTRNTFAAALVALIISVLLPTELTSQADHSHGTSDEPCRSSPATRGCSLEDHLLAILRTDGVRAAMTVLDSMAAAKQDIRRDGHGYAHAIGLAAYTGNDEVGEVFALCTPAFQSGCYHGVIQAYFAEYQRTHGDHIESDAVNALCRTHREIDPDRWLLFQCAHGMGHGMLMMTASHLPSALEGCDLVGDPWERESCYGGVFMENIVHETMPHHSVGRPDTEHGPGTHGAAPHAHGPAASGPEPFPALKEDEPFYPCSVLPDRYLTACYQMQTSAVLHFNGSDVSATVRTCSSAPAAYRFVCFQSLGRDISSITLQDHARAMRLCALAPAEFEPACTIGYAKNLVDVTADPADGFAYCNQLPLGEARRACNIAIGEQIWVLVADPQRRESLCATADPRYVDACRLGAGLIDSAPARPTAATNVRSRRG